MNTNTYKSNSLSKQITPYVTRNTLRGVVCDLVTEYLESYSGITNLNFLSNDKTITFEQKIDFAKNNIIEGINSNLYNEIYNNDKNFFISELERELVHFFKKES